MTVDAAAAATFLLVLARTAAWVMAAPVLSARGLSSVGRLAVALALSIFLAPIAAHAAHVPADPVAFAFVALGQALVGLALGWGTGVLLHAFEAAGTAVDVASGFSVATLIDPMSGAPAAIFARFGNLLFVTLLVATNGHHALIDGFVRSFAVVPADRFPLFGAGAFGAAAHAVTGLVVAALEIGAPVLGALFLTEVALALAARFAPQANVFVVGLPLKVMVALLAMGSALVLLPARLPGLLDAAQRVGSSLLR